MAPPGGILFDVDVDGTLHRRPVRRVHRAVAPPGGLRGPGCVAVYRDPRHLLDEHDISPRATALEGF